MNRMRWLESAFRVLLAPVAVYVVILVNPQFVFAYHVRAGNVVLHAPSPLPANAADIAAAAHRRISVSPLYVSTDTYHVFLCDTPEMFAFFAPRSHRAGGIADVYLSRSIFLRPSRIERDRLIGPSGMEAGGERTLTVLHRARSGAHHDGEAPWQPRLRAARDVAAGRLRGLRRQGGFVRFRGHTARLQGEDASARARTIGFGPSIPSSVAELLDHRGMNSEALLSRPIDAAPLEAELAAR